MFNNFFLKLGASRPCLPRIYAYPEWSSFLFLVATETDWGKSSVVFCHSYGKNYTFKHFCGSMKFWSGSADPKLWLMDPDWSPDLDPDSDPDAIWFWILLFSSVIFKFFAYYFLKVHLHDLTNIIKVIKKLQNSRDQCISYYFCLMLEGSGPRAEYGPISLTNGSGCGYGSTALLLNVLKY